MSLGARSRSIVVPVVLVCRSSARLRLRLLANRGISTRLLDGVRAVTSDPANWQGKIRRRAAATGGGADEQSPPNAASFMLGMSRRSEDRGVPAVAPLASIDQDDGGAPRYDLKP